MTVDQWATTISGFLAVALTVGAAFRWLIKHYLKEAPTARITARKPEIVVAHWSMVIALLKR